MRILLTGASGLIGTRLAHRLLNAGHRVTIGDVAPSEEHGALWQRCDVRDTSVVQRLCRNKDWIIHLAGIHADGIKPASLYREVNAIGTLNVCDAAAEAGVENLIYLSSTSVYGNQSGDVDEERPLRPVDDYGRSVREAEQMCNRWRVQDRERRRLVMVRAAPIFGEGTRGNVYQLIRQVARGHFLMIGAGRNRRSLAYADNLAGFLAHLVKHKADHQIINYADKPDIDMLQLVGFLREQIGEARPIRHIPYLAALLGAVGLDLLSLLTGKKFGITRERVVKFGAESRFAANRVIATGYSAPYTIEEGLRRTMEADFQTTLVRREAPGSASTAPSAARRS